MPDTTTENLPPPGEPGGDTELYRKSDRSETACRRLCERSKDWMSRSARYLLGNREQDAEDALQEALVALWKAVPRFPESAHFHRWARKILKDACLNLRRERRRRPDRRAAPLPEDEFGPASDGSLHQSSAGDPLSPKLAQAIEQLSPEEQRLIEFRYFTNLTVSEIAEEMGVTDRTIRTWTVRAMEKLRKTVEAPPQRTPEKTQEEAQDAERV